MALTKRSNRTAWTWTGSVEPLKTRWPQQVHEMGQLEVDNESPNQSLTDLSDALGESVVGCAPDRLRGEASGNQGELTFGHERVVHRPVKLGELLALHGSNR